MIKIYFDDGKGAVLVNGNKVASPCYAEDNFAVQYFPFDDLLIPVQHTVCKAKSDYRDMIAVKHRDALILKFLPRKIPRYEDCYIRKSVVCKDVTHLLSCSANREYCITIETRDEIVSLPLPTRADDAVIKAKALSDGQLLYVEANLCDKKYIAVLHYADDYTLLLSLLCDDVCIDESGIVVKDILHDCMQRTCVRTLSFDGECFREKARYFQYDCKRNFPDEIIPYVFLESLGCGDDETARSLCCAGLQNKDWHETFKDFVTICDSTEYSPYRVVLAYGDDGFYTRTFDFEVDSGKIYSVNCV